MYNVSYLRDTAMRAEIPSKTPGEITGLLDCFNISLSLAVALVGTVMVSQGT